ncbi:Fur family transcriptional regulator [Burkholderia pseudomallei]|uniref:Fur family transcriptional regulator n=1 Tax=Burkholderia pseudomallei TaxID=28450 RepID=UPI00016B04EC|nr:Fur family transcriptional regulator [Burkholderia pseudomallei]AGR69052.1 ferric uptake regulator family protein [Burkholderia pseudomallei MSHR305]AGZ30408.1 ferric uptake regulator family protein [Burkholderia pseudomallei NCTC 13179]AHK67851.1 ferric uptake regulator family protein [Burkholderia pseudomallei MSHR520]AIP81731.1 ferric uptake regulator family protein [Burkholderia pseudomallei]KGD40669.1 ferric uptake regulator family protein [Burkholderia pseudomallei]
MQLTANQQRVLETLQQANGPLSAYALLDRLRDRGFSAPTQVYRALERLAEHDLVHRLETLNAYVSCTHPGRCQHDFRAFAICDVCGHVDEFANTDLRRCLGRWIKESAFSLRSSTIELHGECATCSGARMATG